MRRAAIVATIALTLLAFLAGCAALTGEVPAPPRSTLAVATATQSATAVRSATTTAAPQRTAAPAPTAEAAPTVTRLPTPATQAAGGIFDVAWDDRGLFRASLLDAEESALDRLSGASFYQIAIDLQPGTAQLTGREAVRYTNQEGTALDAIYFWLYPNLLGGSSTVSNLVVGGSPVEPAYSEDGAIMEVPLAEPLAPGTSVVVGMDFAVEVPTELGRNYGILADVEGVMALAHFYPQIAVYDDDGWNTTPAPSYGDVVYADVAFYLVRVTAPADQVVVASGAPVDVAPDQVAGTTFAIGPARDFYLAVSDGYTAVSKDVGDIAVNSYAPVGEADGAELVLEDAVAALDVFTARFGRYPYTEMDLVSTRTSALGIEYPGIMAITLQLYDLDARLGSLPVPVILESTVVHEVAHQWFYGVVGNDQIDEPWLDESLVQYATLLYYRDRYGPAGAAGFRASLESRWERVDREPIPIGLPVAAYTQQEYGAIVYGRGPLFLEALVDEMGQATFDDFLRDYYQTEKWDIATTERFKALAESHCDCDLTPLFEEWVFE
jgi:hypothetical protein